MSKIQITATRYNENNAHEASYTTTILEPVGAHRISTEIEALETWVARNQTNSADSRPADMAELARMVAKELRKLPINAIAEFANVYVLRVQKRDPNAFTSPTYWHPWTMYSPLLDNLTPSEIASLIQAEEAKRTAEWAGDI